MLLLRNRGSAKQVPAVVAVGLAHGWADADTRGAGRCRILQAAPSSGMSRTSSLSRAIGKSSVGRLRRMRGCRRHPCLPVAKTLMSRPHPRLDWARRGVSRPDQVPPAWKHCEQLPGGACWRLESCWPSPSSIMRSRQAGRPAARRRRTPRGLLHGRKQSGMGRGIAAGRMGRVRAAGRQPRCQAYAMAALLAALLLAMFPHVREAAAAQACGDAGGRWSELRCIKGAAAR